MTRKEFEALLLKKGFNNVVEENTFCQKLYSDGDSIIEARFDLSMDYMVYFTIVTRRNGSFNNACLVNSTLFYDTITEHKLDEILSQFTKIKTALEMINHIAKGE